MILTKPCCICILLLLVACDRTGEPPAPVPGPPVPAATQLTPATTVPPEDAMQPFAPGQVWTYDTRPGESASRLTVYRVESHPKLGEIVHIHVKGVRIKNDQAPGGFSNEIGHLPYSGEALRKSVRQLESQGAPPPPSESGYNQWRSSFDAGKAGVWTLPLSEAIAAMETALNQ